jgi:hypothetical protein
MDFLASVVRAINRHGIDLVYKRTEQDGAYNVETGTVAQTTTDYTAKMYPKQIIANNYKYPTLIGKEVVMFYLTNSSLGFVPKLNDEITYSSVVYRVESYEEHSANTQVALYKIIATRG